MHTCQKLLTNNPLRITMHLLPSFSLIFSSISVFAIISVHFQVCKAVECSLNEKYTSKVLNNTIIVDQSGQGNFKTIQEAVNNISSGNDRWIRILARSGIYLEKVSIPEDKPCIVLEGESGGGGTIISWGDHDKTDTSATFTSFADNFVAKNITFKNSYNHEVSLNNFNRLDGLKGEITQALAARIYGNKSSFYQCGFIGMQDTLWDVEGLHYFKSCYIEGSIDFIFGGGQSFYEDSRINVTVGLLPREIYAGFIVAQHRESQNDPSGFVFKGGIVSGSGQVYLGRAYGPYSRVIFIETKLDMAVVPEGWDPMSFKGHENNFTFVEIGCQGQGSNVSKRVSWEKRLNDSELSAFTISSFVDQEGWIAKQP